MMSITKNTKSMLCLLVLASVGFGVRSAEARLITWEFAGEISTVFDPQNQLDGAIVLGSPFSVSFTYESTTPDRFPNALDNGIYLDAIKSLTGQFGEIAISNPEGVFGRFAVTNDALADIVFDSFGLKIGIDETSSPVGFNLMNLTALDLTGTMFSDDSLPVFPPDLDSFTSTSLILQDQFQTVWVRGVLTSIIPEPTSLVLFALTGVLAFKRKQSQTI